MDAAATAAPVDHEMTTWRTFVCTHVTQEGAPVVSVSWQADPPLLVASCARPNEDHAAEHLTIECWGHVRGRDPSLVEVEEHLNPGIWCHREQPGAPWVIEADETPAAA